MLDRVEEHHLIAAVLDRLGLRPQARRVVAAALDGAGAANGRTRVSLRDPDRDRRGAALEVGADRRGDHREDVFRRRLDAEEHFVGDHEGADVEAAFAARNPFVVDVDELFDRLDEHCLRHRRHRHAVGRVAEAFRVGVGAEQIDATVVAPIGLQPLEDFLRVVQHRGRRIEREVGAGFDARGVPALVRAVADDRHVIGEHAAEARILELGGAVGVGCRIGLRLDVEVQPE